MSATICLYGINDNYPENLSILCDVLDGWVDMQGRDLWGLDLSSLNLSGAILWNASIPGVNFRGSDISGAAATDTELLLAGLHGAYQIGVDLRPRTDVEAAP